MDTSIEQEYITHIQELNAELASARHGADMWKLRADLYAQTLSNVLDARGGPLTRLDTPEPCSCDPCANVAYWLYSDCPIPGAVCYACMRLMSNMNSENEEVFAVALRDVGQEVQA